MPKNAVASKAFYIKQLIMDHLDELEDVYLAEQRLEQLRQGNDEILGSEEFWSGLDVDVVESLSSEGPLSGIQLGKPEPAWLNLAEMATP